MNLHGLFYRIVDREFKRVYDREIYSERHSDNRESIYFVGVEEWRVLHV